MALEIRITKSNSPKPRPPDSALGFGKFFHDHALLIEWTEGKGWHDARVEPYHALALDPASSVLHYGQAMFEGLKAYRGPDGGVHLFRPQAHAQRMSRGAPRLCLPSLDPDDFVHALKTYVEVAQEWVPGAKNTSLYIRPTLIADEAFLGVRPSNHYVFFTIACPVGSYYGGDALKPVRIWVEREQVRASRGGLGAVKAAANYVASLDAAVRAKKLGYDQVLWLDAHDRDHVEEVGTMNFFAVLGDTLVTPPLSDSILAGVTRDSILTIAPELGLKAEERPLSISEMVAAQGRGELLEVFGSGTAAVISPVGELGLGDQKLIIADGEPGPVALKLYEALIGIQRGHSPDPRGWRVPVC